MAHSNHPEETHLSIDMTKRAETAMLSLTKIADKAVDAGVPVGDIEVNMILAIDRSLSGAPPLPKQPAV